ncbi:MAG: HAD family phosphatase [Myxococcales bacterium]|nr:HAD family phosphatase [Myxococcales bacterium]
MFLSSSPSTLQPALQALLARGAVAAVAFDMDGTLVDSETLAEQVVEVWLRARGVTRLEHAGRALHGLSWLEIARFLERVYHTRVDDAEACAVALSQAYHARFVGEAPRLLPGAGAAIVAACMSLPSAIVTSSDRDAATSLISRLRLDGALGVLICAEDCARTKPDALPYALACERLGCAPSALLVFEDSDAGLASASAAGARAVAITRGDADAIARAHAVGHVAIDDFDALPPTFFRDLGNALAREASP